MGIEVSGPFPDSKQPFIALIDTGFSGFLSLPTIKALPLGLVLHGTTTVVLADGSQQSKFTCRGMIEFCGQKEVGLVILEPEGDEALVGMEFPRPFKRTLFIVPETGAVILVSSEEIKASLKAAAEEKAATNEPATAAETASAQVAPPAEKATPPGSGSPPTAPNSN